MYADWIHSLNGLPREGQRIEFVLDHRSVIMEGTYMQQAFFSHWAEYTVERVRSWRNLTQKCSLAAPARSQPERDLGSSPRYAAGHQPLLAGGVAHAA